MNCVKNKVSIVYYIKHDTSQYFTIHHFLVQQIRARRIKQQSEKHFHRENSWTCKSAAVSHAETFSGSIGGKWKATGNKIWKAIEKPGELDKEK